MLGGAGGLEVLGTHGFVDLLAHDGDGAWSLDAEAGTLALDTKHRHPDLTVDHDRLAGAPCEYQHRRTLFRDRAEGVPHGPGRVGQDDLGATAGFPVGDEWSGQVGGDLRGLVLR